MEVLMNKEKSRADNAEAELKTAKACCDAGKNVAAATPADTANTEASKAPETAADTGAK